MLFTYNNYKGMLEQLQEHHYSFASYHNYHEYDRCVILRHDIDNSLEAAVDLGEIEASYGVSSTFFVLLRSDFYNVFSSKSYLALKKLQNLKHEVGLHFDEAFYGCPMKPEDAIYAIKKEAEILSAGINSEVSTVSMHRPSKEILEADLQIPGIINSYGKKFFHEFKYLSDSRRRWREPVDDIIQSEQYKNLHILTHAFWYHNEEKSIEESIRNYILCAKDDRYKQLKDNITDLESIVKEGDL